MNVEIQISIDKNVAPNRLGARSSRHWMWLQLVRPWFLAHGGSEGRESLSCYLVPQGRSGDPGFQSCPYIWVTTSSTDFRMDFVFFLFLLLPGGWQEGWLGLDE